MSIQPGKLAKSVLEVAIPASTSTASQKQVGNKTPQVTKLLGESARQSSVPLDTTTLWLTELQGGSQAESFYMTTTPITW